MKKQRKSISILVLLLVFVLAVACVIQMGSFRSFALEEVSEDQPAPWYDSIPEMLAAGEYEEGVAVVGIDMSQAAKVRDPAASPSGDLLTDSAEEIMTVEGGELLVETGRLSSSQSDEGEDKVCIASVRREDLTTEQILYLLAEDDRVVFAEPNYLGNINEEEEIIADAETVGESEEAVDADMPGNTAVTGQAQDVTGLQWGQSEDASMHAAGKSGDVSMKTPGWPDGSNMDHEIIVAILDGAVDFSNPDLADRAYTFSQEFIEEYGCDEHGYNALYASDGKLDVENTSDHASHVAGIIGASWDGKGISGVASNVKIVSVQHSDPGGTTSLINALRGLGFIKTAKENDVDIRVVNCSWGLQQSSRALDSAVTELGKHGIISCFSAGNDARDVNATPNLSSMLANNPYAVIVAATDLTGALSNFSNFGKGIVTLGAPGSAILSCVKTASASYLPAAAENNKFYENFEGEGISLQVYQVDEETGEKIEGTEGVIVSGNEEMGFEGEHVIKVTLDTTRGGGYFGTEYTLQIDLGDVSGSGIAAGDSFAFAYGGKKEVSISSIVDTASGSESDWILFDMSEANCMSVLDYELKEGIDTSSLSILLTLDIEDENEVYLDTIGIGNEKQPYAFKDGTSMATPAVVGAAAVLASRHYDELDGKDAASAKKLAGYVRSSVRPMDSLSDVTSTGGIIDLSVDEASEEPAQQPVPDITKVSVSGTGVILEGTGFGAEEGTVAARQYVIGNFQPLEAEVSDWSDSKVTVNLAEEFEGTIEVVLTTAGGKQDTFVQYVSRGKDVFENDHSIGSKTADPFLYDEPDAADPLLEPMGDLETSGLLIAGDGKLYYMPQFEKLEKQPAYKEMYCYDPKTDSWSAAPSYPEWIKLASGAWLDGKLYVKGTTVGTYESESGTIPYYYPKDEVTGEETSEVRVYSYTPGDAGWEACSAEKVDFAYTLFAAGDHLMLAGTSKEDGESWPFMLSVLDYDPSSGASEPLSQLQMYLQNPDVAYAGGQIYIYKPNQNMMYVLDENLSADEDSVIEMPEYYYTEEGSSRSGSKNALQKDTYALVSYGDYLVFTGPAAKDGSSDTYILMPGETAFQPYDKRVSDGEVFKPSAAILNGRLYVIAGSVFEPDHRIFRSTALTDEDPDSDVPSGDVPSGDDSKDKSPETGDQNQPILWILLIAISLLAAASLLIVRVRQGKH